MRRRLAPVLAALVLMPAALAAQAPTPDEAVAALEAGVMPVFVVEGQDTLRIPLEQRMAQLSVPAVSVAVMLDGELAWARAWGVADAVTDRPATAETLFQAASISKPVAALALLRMVEAGHLHLDADVNETLASWTLADDDGFAADSKVTLRRLLSHTAGTTVWGFPGYPADGPLPSTVEVLQGAGNTDPVGLFRAPGEDWQYSGGGYTVAQLVAEDVMQSDFADLMDEWVLGPAGMTRSTYRQPLPAERRSEAAVAHRGDGTPYEGGMHAYPELAAAGLWTTPSELVRFMRAVQDAAAGRAGALLSPAMAASMLEAGPGDWGLGPTVQYDGAHFGHGGSNAGFRATFTASIGEGYGVAVMTNSDQGGLLAGEVALTVANLYGWDDPRPALRRIVMLDHSDIERLLGRYRIEAADLEVVVVEDREGIAVQAPNGIQRFSPESPTVFWDRATGQTLSFELDPGGAVVAMTLGAARAVRVGGG
jgi:CubicO group peptidase (beta-lactamase class C family)